jgi:uncharacterized membrane protein YkvA (DUF1232 family)
MTSWPVQFGLFRTLVAEARLALRLLREPRVPRLIKGLPLVALGYLFVPIDVLPDFVPLLGQIDDLGLLLLVLQVFRRVCPSDAVAFHRDAIVQGRPYGGMPKTDAVIDTEWKRI